MSLTPTMKGSQAGLSAVPNPSNSLASSALAACSKLFPTFNDFGNPELPVTNAIPFRRATNAPVGTFTHQTMPV